MSSRRRRSKRKTRPFSEQESLQNNFSDARHRSANSSQVIGRQNISSRSLIPGTPITPLELLNTRPPGMPKEIWDENDDEEFMRFPETPSTSGSKKRHFSPVAKFQKKRPKPVPNRLEPLESPREQSVKDPKYVALQPANDPTTMTCV